MKRRQMLQVSAAIAGLGWWPASQLAASERERRAPILVVVELSGGNDGLNSVVPIADDAYYRWRPTIALAPDAVLPLDAEWGFNPGMLGLHRLWQDGHVALVHGCGYAQPSYSHFTSMAYWHTGAPHSGDALGWLGRTADALAPQPRANMLINVADSQSLAVRSAVHTPVVFDDPERFARHRWMGATPVAAAVPPPGNSARDFLHAVDRSAQSSAAQIRAAWRDYRTPVDYGIAPMDLPKVAACIAAGLETQLYHVAFRNNAFDTHVQQPALHRRLLSYACDGLHGFVRDLQRLGQADRVVIMVHSEFGRRVPENANLGTDHGTANNVWLIGQPIAGGHYGVPPSLTELVEGENLAFTTDFRRVYATVLERWLGVDAGQVLGGDFATLDVLA